MSTIDSTLTIKAVLQVSVWGYECMDTRMEDKTFLWGKELSLDSNANDVTLIQKSPVANLYRILF